MMRAFAVYIVLSAIVLGFSYGALTYNAARQPADLLYLGGEDYPLDMIGNLAIVRHGANGHLIREAYISTTFPPLLQPFIKTEYTLMGLLSQVFSLDPTVTYFVIRFLLSLGALITIAWIVHHAFSTTRPRIIAFILILFAAPITPTNPTSGLALEGALNVLPLTRLTLTAPHYLISLIALLLSLCLLAVALDHPHRINAGIAACILGFIAAATFGPGAILVLATLPVFLLLRWIVGPRAHFLRTHLPIFFAYGISLIAPLLYVYIVVYKYGHHLETERLNPFRLTVLEYFLGVGLPYLVSLIALPRLIKQGKTLLLLFAGWVIIHPVAEFFLADMLKFNPIRFFLTPYFVIFGILAVYGIESIVELFKKAGEHRQRLVAFGITGIILVSGLFAYPIYAKSALVCYCVNLNLGYPKKDMMGAIFWLRDHSNEKDIVMSGFLPGALIPAYAGNRVYTSWWFRLIAPPNFSATIEPMLRFYRESMGPEEASIFLKANRISYVLYSNEEQALSPGKTHLSYPILTEVYHQGNVILYKVQ